MSSVAVFGASGMLGAYVEAFFRQAGDAVLSLSRNEVKTNHQALKERLSQLIGPGSLVVNCVGVIKPQIAVQGTAESIRINSLFPHVLASVVSELGGKLVHITTDCVFSGRTGNYSEKSKHDETDIYGRSKSLGEPDNCTVIRTSIIGEEKNHKRSLIEWAKSQKGNKVRGFTNHTWNGVTCLQLAKVIQQMNNRNLFWPGVRHVFSPSVVNKLELMQLINGAFELGLEIEPFATPEPCHRSLTTDYPEVVSAFSIPELGVQLKDLKNFSWS